MTNQQAIEIFLSRANSRNRKFSEDTQKTYLFYINIFLDGLNKPVEQTTEEDIANFLHKYEDYADKTYNEALTAVKSLFKSLIMCLDIPRDTFKIDPTMRFESIRNPKTKERKSISDVNYHKMLRACTNKRNYAILTFLMKTGVRRDEIINIKLLQYLNRGKDDIITLYVTKGSKERMFILTDDVISAVDEYLKERKSGCDYLFTSNTGTQMDASSLYRMVKCMAKRARLDEDVIDNISPHSFRHSSITNMINDGKQIEKIALWHGHSNVATTMGYVDKGAVDLKELVE